MRQAERLEVVCKLRSNPAIASWSPIPLGCFAVKEIENTSTCSMPAFGLQAVNKRKYVIETQILDEVRSIHSFLSKRKQSKRLQRPLK